MPRRPRAPAGSVFVESRPPAAQVFLDDERVGRTPVLLSDVAAGLHEIRIQRDGYRVWSTTTRVVASERTRVRGVTRPDGQAMNAVLALENGTWYRGSAAGALGEARGEVVFNTSMTGYQEVLTDSVLRRADRHDDLSPDRQLWRRR